MEGFAEPQKTSPSQKKVIPYCMLLMNFLMWTLSTVYVMVFWEYLIIPLLPYYYGVSVINTVITPNVYFGLVCLMRQGKAVSYHLGFVVLLSCPLLWSTLLTPSLVLVKIPQLTMMSAFLQSLSLNASSGAPGLPQIGVTPSLVPPNVTIDAAKDEMSMAFGLVSMSLILPVALRIIHDLGIHSFSFRLPVHLYSCLLVYDVIMFAVDSSLQPDGLVRPASDRLCVMAALALLLLNSAPVLVTSSILAERRNVQNKRNCDQEVEMVVTLQSSNSKHDEKNGIENPNGKVDLQVSMKSANCDLVTSADKVFAYIFCIVDMIMIETPFMVMRSVWMARFGQSQIYTKVLLAKNVLVSFLVPLIIYFVSRSKARRNSSFMSAFAAWLQGSLPCRSLRFDVFSYSWSVFVAIVVIIGSVIVMGCLTVLICQS